MFHVRLFRSDQTNTGVAIANPNTEPASLTLTLVDESGAEIARVETTLPGGGQLARLIDELFTDLKQTDFTGAMTVRSTRSVAVAALAHSVDGVVAIPINPID
jgi:hypothetical protein